MMKQAAAFAAGSQQPLGLIAHVSASSLACNLTNNQVLDFGLASRIPGWQLAGL